MNPAFSIVFFTTLAGLAQGLVVALAAATLARTALPGSLALTALAVGEALLLVALGSSFLHLGHKMRAWRAVLMWRTSWMSREVIVMPAFIAAVGAWWLALHLQLPQPWLTGLAVLAVLLSAALWLCTAMIYACLRFVQEWAHPLTIANYTLIGLSSGLVLAGALCAASGELELSSRVARWALVATLCAWLGRGLSLRRNARLKPKSTLQSATGLDAARVVQKSMGMTAGSFNTKEFFHGVALRTLPRVKALFIALGFALPSLLLLAVVAGGTPTLFLVALVVQLPGLVAERWFFFAQARHPQNLYYQVVS